VERNRKLVVEFIGMFIFMFTVGMVTEKTGAGTLAPIAIGFVLMVMVFAGGHISGGHYNPAVSTAVLIRGKMTGDEWVAYVVTQLIAAVLAGLLVRAIGGHETAAAVAGDGKVFVVELLFTLALTYTVLNVATARGTEGNSFYGLAIGGMVLVGAFAVGSVSGGAFNPAIALGASVTGLFKWSNYWVYLLAELVGGAAGAFAFLFVQPGEKVTGDLQAESTPAGQYEPGNPP
jgi:aquaporin Z